LRLNNIESAISSDPKYLFTLTSCLTVALVYVNLATLQSLPIGIVATAAYFLINATFLGSALFKEEESFFKLILGSLALIMLLTFIGWLALIIYNLDSIRTTLVLVSATIFSSLSNKRMKQRKC
jgi:hypothetical protein